MQNESLQTKILMGLKIWRSWKQCSQKPIGSREACAQKQIYSPRGPASLSVFFIAFSLPLRRLVLSPEEKSENSAR